MKLLTVDGHWSWRPDARDGRPNDLEATLVIEVPGRWIRLGCFYGEAPGSHMIGKHFTAWPVRLGDFHGWNVRFGWWPKPCVTLLAHTHPDRLRSRLQSGDHTPSVRCSALRGIIPGQAWRARRDSNPQPSDP